MTLEISDIVKVSATITPQGVLRREFGIPLFLTNDTTLPTGAGRVSVNASMPDVESVFDESTEPYKAANVYFQQSPYPKNLIIARWINEDAPAIIVGGSVSQLSDFQAINDGSISINDEDFTGIDFSAVTAYADVATTLQTALRAGADASLDQVEITYNAVKARFEISTGSVVGATALLTHGTSAATGTEIASLLGIDNETSIFQQGADAEIIGRCINVYLGFE